MNSISTKQSISTRMKAWIKEEFSPATLFRSLSAGVILYILEIIVVLSFGALIFSGPVAVYLPLGISLVVMGNAILIVVITISSSYAGIIAVEQDAPGAILAVGTLSIMAAMPADAHPEQRLATVIVMIVGAALVTGVLFILLGVFRLGALVRFLPYPVIGGFLAGTGWTLVTGGLNIMTSEPFSLAWLQPDVLLHWLPGLVLGVIILVVPNRFSNPLLLPVIFAGATGLFYLAAVLSGTSFPELVAGNWLVGALPSGSQWQFPLSGSILAQVDWLALWKTVPVMLPLPLISVIAMLLNTSGLELEIKKDMNLSGELVGTGVANILSGLAGGLTGYAAISLSSLNHTMTGHKRLPGLFMAVLMGITAFAGVAVLSYLPKMVLASMVIFLGLAMLKEWVYDAWFKFPRVDFTIILIILVIIAVSGFLQGIGVGLVVTIILFVVSYSRINVIRHAIPGSAYNSRVTRSRSQRALLDIEGDQLQIFKLNGFVFFGTANNLFEEVRKRARLAKIPPRYILLDFQDVAGLDSTGILSFNKLLNYCQDHGLTLVMSGLSGRTAEQFSSNGFVEKSGTPLRFFRDIDHGIEWCENEILAAANAPAEEYPSITAQLEAIYCDSARVQRLIGHMHRLEIAQGEHLIHQGDEPEFLFMIESGQVTAQLENPGKPPVRLERMRGGRAVGEIGFYLGSRRTAAVVADEPTVVYILSRAELQQLEQTDPESASVLHRIFVHLLAERVTHLIRAVNALQR